MATLLRMPSLSPTMEMGAIGSWNKKVGDFVEVGDVLAEVETDKAVMDYEIVDEGYVRKLLVEPGREIAVGTPIAILAESMEEDIAPAEAAATSPAAGPANGGGRAQPSAGQAADAPPPAPSAAPSPPASPPPAPSQPPTDPAPAAPAAPAAPVAIASPATAPAAGEAANGGRIKISPYGRKL
ncbi:MAG: biotin/lipoyl-containing protein, partial [bacterium]